MVDETVIEEGSLVDQGAPSKSKRPYTRRVARVKKVTLTPEVYNSKRRRPRKRISTRFDKFSPWALKTQATRGPGSPWYNTMEEKVWGPRRRGEIAAARTAIPDGYTREKAAVMFAEAEKKADFILAKLKENGVFNPNELPTDDAERAELAMKECLRIGLADVNSNIRIAALGQVLKYCKVAPERKSKVTIESAEDWLKSAIADDEATRPEDA